MQEPTDIYVFISLLKVEGGRLFIAEAGEPETGRTTEVAKEREGKKICLHRQ